MTKKTQPQQTSLTDELLKVSEKRRNEIKEKCKAEKTERSITIAKQTDISQVIDNLARKATISVLKKAYNTSGNYNLQLLMFDLLHDFKIVDNNLSDIISDAYDFYMTAYIFLWEKMAIDNLDMDDTITITLKNKTEKVYTIYQMACKLVSKAIYATKSLNLCTSTKTVINKEGKKKTYKTISKFVYIEDLNANENNGECSNFDKELLKINSKLGINSNCGFDNLISASYNDYAIITDLCDSLNLTVKQSKVVAMRLQGMSVSQVANKLQVSQQAISKTLLQVQGYIATQYPDMIIHFKKSRKSKNI